MQSPFPHALVVIAVTVAAELVGLALRRHGRIDAGRYLVWLTRPFGLWAVLSTYHELQPWTSFKSHPWATFPVYATPWEDLAPGWPLRVLGAMAAAAGVVGLLALALRYPRNRIWPVALLVTCAGAQLAIALAPHGWPGPLHPWKRPYKVYAYSASHVETPAEFLRRFEELHGDLHMHSQTHPPGATLLSYWTKSIEDPVARRNVVVQLALSSLVIPVTWALGTALAGPRVAVFAATLVGLMPAAASLGTYSLDPVFGVVLNLCLLFAVRLAQGYALVPNGLAAGLAFFCASMLQFSWPVAAVAAIGFGSVVAPSHGLGGSAVAGRIALPLLVLGMAHAGCAVAFDFDYVEAFTAAWGVHRSFYPIESLHDSVLALVASPFDLLIGLGPVAATAFVAATVRRGAGLSRDVRIFGAAILVAYAIPLLFGPGSMKFETARTWFWLLPAGAVLAAAELVRRHPGDDRPLLFTAVASAATSLALLCLFNFGQ